jgi:hypothetical protein
MFTDYMQIANDSGDELKKLKVTEDMVKKARVTDGLLGIEKPKHWTQKALEEDGGMKFFGKMLLGGFTGLTPLLFPEMIGSKARYASELDIYEDSLKHKREQAMRQQYVDVLNDPNSTHQQRMGAGVMAGGVSSVSPNPITASTGTAVIDPVTNNILHNQPHKPNTLPASIQEFERWIVENPDASDAQRRDAYDNIVVAPKTLNGTLTNAMTGAPVGGDRQPYLDNTTDQSQAGEQGKTNAGRVAGSDAMYELSTSIIDSLEQLGEYDERTGDFVVGDSTLDLYGGLDKFYPDTLRFGDEAKSNAIINKVLAQLKLSEREKLKGQGQISDSEQKILADSVSVLLSRGIPDELVQREIKSLLNFFMDRRDKADAIRRSGQLPGKVGDPAVQPQPEQTLDELLEIYTPNNPDLEGI